LSIMTVNRRILNLGEAVQDDGSERCSPAIHAFIALHQRGRRHFDESFDIAPAGVATIVGVLGLRAFAVPALVEA
jgi:hypothetical protein